MIALTCIGIDLFLYMSLCSFAFAFTFGDEHGQIEKSPEVQNAKLRRYQDEVVYGMDNVHTACFTSQVTGHSLKIVNLKHLHNLSVILSLRIYLPSFIVRGLFAADNEDLVFQLSSKHNQAGMRGIFPDIHPTLLK